MGVGVFVGVGVGVTPLHTPVGQLLNVLTKPQESLLITETQIVKLNPWSSGGILIVTGVPDSFKY